jgi:hypothetical protein
MMNQEIQNNNGDVKGIVPKTISELLGLTLDGYYQMNKLRYF